jgi:hypothetical protein
MYPCLLVSPRDFVRESLQNAFGHLLERFENFSDFLDFPCFFIIKSSFWKRLCLWALNIFLCVSLVQTISMFLQNFRGIFCGLKALLGFLHVLFKI